MWWCQLLTQIGGRAEAYGSSQTVHLRRFDPKTSWAVFGLECSFRRMLKLVMHKDESTARKSFRKGRYHLSISPTSVSWSLWFQYLRVYLIRWILQKSYYRYLSIHKPVLVSLSKLLNHSIQSDFAWLNILFLPIRQLEQSTRKVVVFDKLNHPKWCLSRTVLLRFRRVEFLVCLDRACTWPQSVSRVHLLVSYLCFGLWYYQLRLHNHSLLVKSLRLF